MTPELAARVAADDLVGLLAGPTHGHGFASLRIAKMATDAGHFREFITAHPRVLGAGMHVCACGHTADDPDSFSAHRVAVVAVQLAAAGELAPAAVDAFTVLARSSFETGATLAKVIAAANACVS